MAATCPDCGVEVQIGVDVNTDEKVALELQTDAPTDDMPRYRIISPGPPLRVERVPDRAMDQFYPDHRYECPGHGNGLAKGTLI